MSLHNEICPNCRSTFEVQGNLDFNADAISIINCPVCKQEIWLPSGFPFPQRWTVTGKVIDRQPVLSPPIVFAPPADNKPVYSDFQLIPVSISDPIKTAGIWVVVVLGLVLLIKEK